MPRLIAATWIAAWLSAACVAAPPEADGFDARLAGAREALAAHDVPEARRRLDAAEKIASSPAQRDQVRQLRVLAEQLQRFYGAVVNGLKKYQPADEITIGNMVAAVVEVMADRVVLFIEGKRQAFTIPQMPAEMALFFARSGADEDSPVAAVFFGAFYAVEGDRGQAKARWQAAQAAGLPVDDLLTLVANAPVAAKPAMPDAEQLTAARGKFQEQFAESIVSARTAAAKAQLAAQMLAAARATQDRAAQYVALEQARDWAVLGGNPQTALAAIDLLGKSFGADVLQQKAKALGTSIAGRLSVASAGEAATAAITLSAAAQNAGRFPLATSLADTAYAAARKSRDSALIKRAYSRRGEALAAERAAKAKAKSPSR